MISFTHYPLSGFTILPTPRNSRQQFSICTAFPLPIPTIFSANS